MNKIESLPPPQAHRGPRVLLVGDGVTALSALRSLAACCDVVGIIRAAAAADPVRREAAAKGIEVWGCDHLRDLTEIIKRIQPDAVVISSFSRILPPDLLALSLFVNVHYAPLPKCRGRANVNWAIINGEKTAGLSVHRVAPGLDDGDILFQQEVEISSTDTAQSVYDRLNAIQQRKLGPAVLRALAGVAGAPQDEELATYGCGRTPDDGEIDWRQPSTAIDRLFRALSPPFPGAFTFHGTRRLTLSRAVPLNTPPLYAGRVPGRVVGRSRAEGFVDVLTGDGVFRLFDVRTEDGATVRAAEVIRSTRATLGLSTLVLLRAIETLEQRLAVLEARVNAPSSPAPPDPTTASSGRTERSAPAS